MTLLLFLGSLALLNYILGRGAEAASSSGAPQVPGDGADASPDEAAVSRGLLALEQALEAHGRGQTPQARETGSVEPRETRIP